VLRLDRPGAEPVLFGTSVELSGIARGLGPVRVSVSSDAMRWSPVAAPTRIAGGAVSITVRPTRTTRYRVEVDGAASPALLVQVAPRLQLVLPPEPGALAGTVRPKLAGVPVTIERRKGAAWAPVGAAAVDLGGAFRAELPLAPGSYRARVDATAGLTAGTSPVLQVSG
jgi:hypothetical protein